MGARKGLAAEVVREDAEVGIKNDILRSLLDEARKLVEVNILGSGQSFAVVDPANIEPEVFLVDRDVKIFLMQEMVDAGQVEIELFDQERVQPGVIAVDLVLGEKREAGVADDMLRTKLL